MQSSAKSVWHLCERSTILTETARKLPRAILFSVATAESGRFNVATGVTKPWPWTINAEGQAYYFETKTAAIAATRRLLNEGIRSIDVGCMQVNLRYHPDAFADLDEAFEPKTNVAYGASFLTTLHARSGSWPKAIAEYHSQSATLNQPYFARVIGIWTGERSRIAALAHEFKEQAASRIEATLRAGTETPDSTVVVAGTETLRADLRPAPMVLDADAADVREVAGATVGLRLSIGDEEHAGPSRPIRRPPPRVIDTPSAGPTVLADASPGA
jgi:hypothetical protein